MIMEIITQIWMHCWPKANISGDVQPLNTLNPSILKKLLTLKLNPVDFQFKSESVNHLIELQFEPLSMLPHSSIYWSNKIISALGITLYV